MNVDTINFGDCAYLVRDTFLPSESSQEFYVGLEHIEPNSLRISSYGIASNAISQKFIFCKGDILFGKLRPYFRKVAIARFNGVCSTDFWVVRAKKGFDQKFLFYVMASQDFVDFVNQASEGTRMPRAKWGYAENYKIKDISFDEQKAIAKILSSLDDKIELNRQMNATLEAMAKALFKAWFVDFEPVRANSENRPSESASPEIARLFPSEFENDIPKGWRNIKLEELIDTISVTHKFPKDKIVFLNTSDISDGQVLCHKYSQVEGLPGQAKKSIKKNDILYSEIRPANKRFAYIDFEADDYVVSTKLMVLRAKSFVDPILIYYFLKSDEIISHLQMLAESRSGTFPQITFEQVKRLEMLVPNNEVLENYTRFLKSIFEKVNQNYKQNLKLAEIRDSLLPRLISGKIPLTSFENEVKGAIE